MTRHDNAVGPYGERPCPRRACRTARLTGPLGIALLVLAWGSTFTAIKIGLEDAPPAGVRRHPLGDRRPRGRRHRVGPFGSARPAPHLAGARRAGLLERRGLLRPADAGDPGPAVRAGLRADLPPAAAGGGAGLAAARRVDGRRQGGRAASSGSRGIVLVSTGALDGHISAAGRGVRRAGRAGLGDRDDRVQAQPGPGRPAVGGGGPVRRRRPGADRDRRGHRGHRHRLDRPVRGGADLRVAGRHRARVGAVVRPGRDRRGQPRVGVHLPGAGGRRPARRAAPRRDVPPGPGGRQRARRRGHLPGQPADPRSLR